MPTSYPYHTVKHRYFDKDVEVRHPDIELSGEDFLMGLRLLDGRCEAQTIETLFAPGREVALIYGRFGYLLSLLDRLGGCHWGCDREKHTVTYVAMRAVSASRAGVRLMQFGLYDEALTHARSIGEAANLLILVGADQRSCKEWTTAVRQRTKSKLSPASVRTRLKALKISSPINSRRYGVLSELIHPTAPVLPQGYSDDTQPRIGGMFQDQGAVSVLHELSLSVSLVTAAATRLLAPPVSVRRRIRKAIIELTHATLAVITPPFPEDWPTAIRMARQAAEPKAL